MLYRLQKLADKAKSLPKAPGVYLMRDDKRRFFRPCLLYPIKQCTAPCAAKVSKETYRDDVQRLIRFLDGDKTKVLEGLERDMLEASRDLNFEKCRAATGRHISLAASGRPTFGLGLDPV